MTIHSVQLEDRGVLRVAGEDAASFLQGLLTNDVESLAVGEARYAASLSRRKARSCSIFSSAHGAPTGAKR